jgi:predicted ribosome quality control (RQC) complex YloA/Tae2 family protein
MVSMGFDFFTIRNLAVELDTHLRGKTLVEVGSSPTELGMGCALDRCLRARFGREGWVCLCPGPMPRALENRAGAERFLAGAAVEKVWADPRDRILWIGLVRPDSGGCPSYGRLGFELIHPHFQAHLVSEQTGLVVGAWGPGGRTRLKPGQPYAGPPGPGRLLPGVDSFGAFAERWAERLPEAEGLARQIAGLDQILADQLLVAAGISDQPGGDQQALGRLWTLLEDAYTLPPGPGGYLWRVGPRLHFSGLAPLLQDSEPYPSISQAILRAKPTAAEGPGAAGKGDEGREKQLWRTQQVLRRRQRAWTADLAEAEGVEELERKAYSLLANLGAVPAGAESAEIPDVYDRSGLGRVRVELDRNKTAAENAAWLLRLAKRYRRRREVLPGLVAQAEGQLTEIERMLTGGEDTRDTGESWCRERRLKPASAKGGRPGERTASPRRYRTTSGWSVWVGRNNRENDLLSHRLAVQNDIWFHAQGYSGAHVVLRREGRREEPSQQTIREAAGLAAYWSKGKTARKVPVVYTLVKYVSKPKGGAPGQALVRREKTLVVEPALLRQEGDQGPAGA